MPQTQPPPTMRAYTHLCAGHPHTVLTQRTIPKPEITSPTQLLICTSHCALNPGASIIMHLLPFTFRASPAIPEMDFSGTIVDIGPDILASRQLDIGMKVFGSIPVSQHVKNGCGALAEYIVVEHDAVVQVPENTEMKEAAGSGIAGATALALIKAADIKEGERVLVIGAGGGIGHLVLQMCSGKVGESGKVVAITSARHEGWLKDLAPKCEVIKRDEVDVVKYLHKTFTTNQFDLVLDASGIQTLYHSSPTYLKPTGTYVSVGPRAQSYTYLSMLGTIGGMASNFLWPRVLGGTPRKYMQVAAVSSAESLEELRGLVGSGRVMVHVGLGVGWEGVFEAYEGLLGERAGGKVVVRVANGKN